MDIYVSYTCLKITSVFHITLRVPHLSDASQKQIYKFFHIYKSPLRIVKIVGNNAFSLAAPNDETKIKGTYNRFHLWKYYVISQTGLS